MSNTFISDHFRCSKCSHSVDLFFFFFYINTREKMEQKQRVFVLLETKRFANKKMQQSSEKTILPTDSPTVAPHLRRRKPLFLLHSSRTSTVNSISLRMESWEDPNHIIVPIFDRVIHKKMYPRHWTTQDHAARNTNTNANTIPSSRMTAIILIIIIMEEMVLLSMMKQLRFWLNTSGSQMNVGSSD